MIDSNTADRTEKKKIAYPYFTTLPITARRPRIAKLNPAEYAFVPLFGTFAKLSIKARARKGIAAVKKAAEILRLASGFSFPATRKMPATLVPSMAA